ncbi:MAG TPA: class I SAM-dependent methyltransferase [Bradyrhizobium sp.]|uniref:class I SAM-dependent methyltransferase n=1 Tax=Bradyrhizobium sp. TaxID=376 RepID=UPI002D7EAF53|nr:class I SAM-dependent methyltransferase [Bradyrhizobium sp.]HET7887518.1 class I SAM-dependent methyltransferase [Bradyrhizobium sp.]
MNRRGFLSAANEQQKLTMRPADLRLRAARPSSLPCKICGAPSALYGVTDFSRPCDIGAPMPPVSGLPVYYRRCETCGFLFTDAFDDWDIGEFKTHIYNDDYVKYDPDYLEARPSGNASWVAQFWSEHKSGMRVLDYGGGNDVLCSSLRASGFKEAVTYDPMVAEHALQPSGKFDLVTCFETMEHLPDPIAGIGKMVEFVADPGAVLYTTLVQPDDLPKTGMSWWYIGPRNGHVSIFTRQALAAAWGKYGFKTASFSELLHIAFRTLPENWRMKVQ